jgi:NAD(P)H dehydrogenase (quinone)
MKYSVIGATGQVGGATARALLAQHHGVRAVVRNPAAAQAWASRGAEVAIADLTDAEALTEAFADVDGAFVMTPPYLDSSDPAAENREALAALRTAILAAGVPYVVYLSSIGSQHDHGLGAIAKTYEMEQAFRQMSVASVALRAGWFMENYKGQIPPARENGTLPSMLDPLDLAVPMIATEDIGEAAAELLVRGPHGTSVVELATLRAYSSNDVARALTPIVGRSVEAVVIPREQRVEVYRSWGLSRAGAVLMSEMIDGFNSGWIRFEGGSVERIYGTTSLQEALRSLAKKPAA